MTLMRHYVDEKPTARDDTSRVLCIRGGDRKAGKPYAEHEQSEHGWTLNPNKVTCPHCLEWLHS